MVSEFAASQIQEVAHQLVSVVGAAAPAGISLQRLRQFGINDTAIARHMTYTLNAASVADASNTTGYENTIPDVGTLISLSNQTPIDQANLVGSQNLTFGMTNYGAYFAQQGIDLGPSPTQGGGGLSGLWGKIIEMSSTAGPMDAAVRAYQRTRGSGDADEDAAAAEMAFQFQRGGYARDGDRSLIMQPYYPWSIEDAWRLGWMGAADVVAQGGIMAAAGLTRESDIGYALLLNQYLPDAGSLAEWDARGLLGANANMAALGLTGAGDGAVGSFFARAQGVDATAEVYPGQQGDTPKWYDAMVNASRPLPGFSECLQLQWRLRDNGENVGHSVVPGVATWGSEMTISVLQAQGYTQPIIDAMMGLANEPLNVRLVNHVLVEALRHPAVSALATEQFGPDVDWVENVFLDHGFSAAISTVAAAAFRAAAYDEANAEKIELQKEIRKQQQAAVLAAYEIGTLSAANAVAQLQGPYIDAGMAQELVDSVEAKIQASYTQTIIGAAKEAFFGGKINVAQFGTQLTAIGVTGQRLAQYVQEAVWQAGDRVRMLSTGEVLAALKAGFMDGATALIRLTNLGWTAPDAMIEIAMVQHELAEAAAAAADRAVAKQAAQAGLVESAKVSSYDASSLLDLDAYNKASAKGDTVKMAAEVEKAKAAYEDLLLAQLRLSQEGPVERAAVKPVKPIPVPAPDAGAQTGATPAKSTLEPGAAADESGGAGDEAAT